MTRDTFDRFTPQDRGRFGDNESASSRASGNDSNGNDFVVINLHKHVTDWDGKAFLLSRDGQRKNAQWIPKSLIQSPNDVVTSLSNEGSEATYLGTFHVRRWKLQQLGWLTDEDEGQGTLL